MNENLLLPPDIYGMLHDIIKTQLSMASANGNDLYREVGLFKLNIFVECYVLTQIALWGRSLFVWQFFL